MPAEADVDLVVLNEHFADRRGVLVEVGAARPDYLSIGARFRARGWKVVAVEPNPSFCAAHRALGHDILEYACGERDADDVEFFVVDSMGANYEGGEVSFESFSSLGIKDKFADLLKTTNAKVSSIRVKVRRLDTILATHHPEIDRFDVLVIDVEGWELAVLRGLSLGRYRPSVVILENVFDDAAYSNLMLKNGYSLRQSLPPNEIYVRQTWIDATSARLGRWVSRLVSPAAR